MVESLGESRAESVGSKTVESAEASCTISVDDGEGGAEGRHLALLLRLLSLVLERSRGVEGIVVMDEAEGKDGEGAGAGERGDSKAAEGDGDGVTTVTTATTVPAPPPKDFPAPPPTVTLHSLLVSHMAHIYDFKVIIRSWIGICSPPGTRTPPCNSLFSRTPHHQPSCSHTPPPQVGLYLASGLVGRVAEQLSLMDTPRRGRLTRPIPQHIMQVCEWVKGCERRRTGTTVDDHTRLSHPHIPILSPPHPPHPSLPPALQGLTLLEALTSRDPSDRLGLRMIPGRRCGKVWGCRHCQGSVPLPSRSLLAYPLWPLPSHLKGFRPHNNPLSLKELKCCCRSASEAHA